MTHADISSIHWVFVNKKFHFEGTPLVVQNHWWGFPTLPYGVLFSRGWGVQWNDNGGRCGICGDAWGDFPREHEAPLGQLFSCGIFYVLLQIRQICDGNFSPTLHIWFLGACYCGHHNQPWWIFCFQGHKKWIKREYQDVEGLYGYCGPPGCMNYLPQRFRPVLCMFDGN